MCVGADFEGWVKFFGTFCGKPKSFENNLRPKIGFAHGPTTHVEQRTASFSVTSFKFDLP